MAQSRMTNTMTSQNTDISSWDTLCSHQSNYDDDGEDILILDVDEELLEEMELLLRDVKL